MKVPFKVLIGVIAFASCSKDPNYLKQPEGESSSQLPHIIRTDRSGAVVFKEAGDSLDIIQTVNAFRDLLGPANFTPNAVGGRREINWDGVPANLTNNNLFPGDFFGADPALPNARKRGLINTTPGSGFSISDSDFVFINPKYDDQFSDFSPKKTFIAVGSTITDNIFRVPSTNAEAFVQGFGVVFSGVNNAASTSIEFYSGDELLGSFKVPNNGNNQGSAFSFLGVYFPNDKVTRVRIHSGTAPLSAAQDDLTDGGGEDLVIMDDFIYSEPKRLR